MEYCQEPGRRKDRENIIRAPSEEITETWFGYYADRFGKKEEIWEERRTWRRRWKRRSVDQGVNGIRCGVIGERAE